MTDSVELVKLIFASIIVTIFCIFAIILPVVIIHLSYYCHQLKNKEQQRSSQWFIFLTIATIALFELVVLLVIPQCIQMILIDVHNVTFIDPDTLIIIEYIMVISDTMAHVSVVIIFILRFQHTFYKNAIFGEAHVLFRVLYFSVAALAIFGVGIIITMGIEHELYYPEHRHSDELMLSENILEVLFHIMLFVILYLFISKLYVLLKFSIQSHIKSGKKNDFIKELIETTKASIEHSKSGDNASSNMYKSKRDNEPRSLNTANTMTIDGRMVHMTVHEKKPAHSSREASPDPSPSPHSPVELTVTTKAMSDHSDVEHTDDGVQMKGVDRVDSSAMDLIRVMTKMSVLVTVCVVMCIFGAIGHVIIELRVVDHDDIGIDVLWAEILPMLDVVITSLMLYLQFSFTHRMYRNVLGRLDVWFLSNCLKLTQYVWAKEGNSDEQTASRLVETQSTKTLETVEIAEMQT